MMKESINLLEERLDNDDKYRRLMAIRNPHLHRMITGYIDHCNPDRIFVSDGGKKSLKYIKRSSY